MNLYEAETLAKNLMREHGVSGMGWIFVWLPRSVGQFGVARFGPKEIGLSRPLTLLNDEKEVRDTILHEIAHVLAGSRAGHGPAWRRVALMIGCNGDRQHVAKTPPAPKVGTCPSCGRTTKRHRVRKALACGECCRTKNGGRWSEDYVFVWDRVSA
jgi:predicted SprT family Zn-dependent metalloprotease